jgi:DNA invertase Pin-like site-specific DNA recombinase
LDRGRPLGDPPAEPGTTALRHALIGAFASRQPGFAHTRGRVGGRRRSYTVAQQREAQRLYDSRQLTVEQIARAVSSSTTTVYRYLDVTVIVAAQAPTSAR